MTRLLKHVALISGSDRISARDLMPVAAALQKQATRDLGPIWDIEATVDAFADLDDMPTDYWPILILDDIQVDGAAGVHRDDDNQPFALVRAHPDRDVWSLTCSHELCEMLVDPSGNRLRAGTSPRTGGRVNFLVEVCDPSEGAKYAYRVNEVAMSDFYTPNYFEPVAASGVRYSFGGHIEGPRSILPDGYLSWVELETNSWWQMRWFDTESPTYVELGPLPAGGSFRSEIDQRTGAYTARAIAGDEQRKLLARAYPPDRMADAARGRAERLRKCIAAMKSGVQAGASANEVAQDDRQA